MRICIGQENIGYLFHLKMRNRQQLEEIGGMLAVDEGFGVGVFANTCADVFVQDGVGKAEVVLVALVGEAI